MGKARTRGVRRGALLAGASAALLAGIAAVIRSAAPPSKPTAVPAPGGAVVLAPPGASQGTAARLTVQSTTVSLGQSHLVSGAGWPPLAPLTLASVHETGAVAHFARLEADATGDFAHSISLREPGRWTHRAYWHPDPSVPPRDVRALISVMVAPVRL